ncbi:MAG: hypothetical protein M1828_004397 [Chrysothrix sp. TS-e1954]|nr:MAG: hypothetical protein M1828_004397 [Chrysothrix sp. TS-e1954]
MEMDEDIYTTMPSGHTAASSSESSFSSSSSTGASYTLILEHVFQYPGTYELKSIPLRTMYTINAEQRAQQPNMNSYSQSSSNGNSSGNNQKTTAQAATAQFSNALINHIARMPSQPCSLPPSFITNFLLKAFPLELELVDFPQALTGLDYLRDLERRRRRETEASLRRIGVEPGRLGHLNDISTRHTGVAAWLQSTEKAERKVEALYTQVYIGLRRWILINEMKLEPFNKHNCLAMLNTLYPPSSPGSMPPSPTAISTPMTPSVAPNPTTTLTPTVLKNQRDAFFKWIRTVEAKGSDTLRPLMAPDRRHAQDSSGWSGVHETLDAYLRVANHIIEEYNEVKGLEDFDREGLKKNRKKDSGISFGSRHESTQSSVVGSFDRNKALPTPPVPAKESFEELGSSRQQIPNSVNNVPEKGLSRLEKVARELRRIKLTRNANAKVTTDDHDEDLPRSGTPGTSYSHSRNNSNNSNEGPASNLPSQPPSPGPRGRSATGGRRSESRRPLNLRRSFSRGRVEAPLPSPSVDEMPRPPTSGSTSAGGGGSKTLRKLRSFGDLKRPSTSGGETRTDAYAAFNKEEMMKARAEWEAQQAQRREDDAWMVRGEEIGMAQ